MPDFYTQDKKIHPIQRRGLYGTPRYKKYSDQLSGIQHTDEAHIASNTLFQEFKEAGNRGTKIRIKRALVQRANRARVASHNTNLSPEVRSREAEIATVFEKAHKQMDVSLSEKDAKSVVRPSTQKLAIAGVKDEAEGAEYYLKMEKLAKEEGRLEDAKVYHAHYLDEIRHKKENKKIISHPDPPRL